MYFLTFGYLVYPSFFFFFFKKYAVSKDSDPELQNEFLTKVLCGIESKLNETGLKAVAEGKDVAAERRHLE